MRPAHLTHSHTVPIAKGVHFARVSTHAHSTGNREGMDRDLSSPFTDAGIASPLAMKPERMPW